jgi:hypothetical protein
MKARVGDQLRREARRVHPGQDRCPAGRVRAGAAPGENPDCVLQGLWPLRLVRARAVDVPWGTRSGRGWPRAGWAFLCQLLARGQPEYADPDSTRDPGLAHSPAQRHDLRRGYRLREHPCRGLGRPLRAGVQVTSPRCMPSSVDANSTCISCGGRCGSSLKHSRKKARAWLESVEQRIPELLARWAVTLKCG